MAERNEKGQFVAGSGGGPGRPRKHAEEEYLYATTAAVSPAQWKTIMTALRQRASRGDVRAIKLLADYLIGVPQQHVDVTSKGERITGYVVISPDDWDKDNAGE